MTFFLCAAAGGDVGALTPLHAWLRFDRRFFSMMAVSPTFTKPSDAKSRRTKIGGRIQSVKRLRCFLDAVDEVDST
jgi:hypothetical protein